MQTPIEIRYEGTVIGTATSASGSLDDGTLYLATAEPMPVGTKLELAAGRETTQVRVVRVAESADPGAVGMIVRALSASEPLEIPMPPVVVVPPRPVSASPPPSARPMSSPTPMRAPSFSTPAPRPAPPVAAAPARETAPPPREAAPPPGPPQATVKGEINRPSQTMPVVRDEAVPEPVGGDDSLNGTSGLVQVEVSGLIDTSDAVDTGSTAELPAVGNGANRRKRSRRKR